MKIRKLYLNSFLSNWNIINVLIGYPFITMLFSPILGSADETHILTVPYRAASLALTLTVLLLNYRSNIKLTLALKLFLLFWTMVLLRMFYDLEIQTDYFIFPAYKNRIWLFSIGLIFLPILSTIKSYKEIDLGYIRVWIYRLGIIFLLVSFFSVVRLAAINERLSANIAFDSISFGKTAFLISIISIYNLITTQSNKTKNFILHGFILLLSSYIALRSGSRGPLLAFLFAIYFLYSFKNYTRRKGIFIFMLLIFATIFIQNSLVDLVYYISPITASRIEIALSGDDLSIISRFDSYSWFWKEIQTSPITGSHFARLQSGLYPGYAHNIFLDILLGFGILGLIIFLFIMSKAIYNTQLSIRRLDNFWLGLIFLLHFVLSFSSGAYYSNPDLNISIVLILLYNKHSQNENRSHRRRTTKLHENFTPH